MSETEFQDITNKLRFAIIIHKITPNSQDLCQEIKTKRFFVQYLFLENIRITKNKTEVIFKNERGEITNGLDFEIIIWRDTKTLAVIRKIIACYFLENKKVFIDKIWGEKDWTANKLRQAEFYCQHNLPVPKTLFLNINLKKEEVFKKITKKLGLPFIAKPIIGSKGNNVFLIKNKNLFISLENKLNLADIIFQEYIPNDGDFRLLFVGNKFIGSFKRIPKKGEFRANIAQGGRGKKIKIDPKMISLGQKVSQLIGIEVLGIDFIKSQKNENYYLLETNGIPQWQGFKKATGINVAEKIIDYVLSLYRKSKV